MSPSASKVLIIAGPTASGKSWVGEEIASATQGLLINGDSMQVYKGLEVVTAQPPSADHHRLYGFLNPQDPCTAAFWQTQAYKEVEVALSQNRLPIIVGGTGLYLKAFMEGLSSIPEIPAEIRKQTRSLYEDLGAHTFFEKLKERDPAVAQTLNVNDKQRVMRAFEVITATGKSLLQWQENTPSPPPYSFFKVLILPPKAILDERIERRFKIMIQAGALEEIKAIRNLPADSSAKKAIGVPELVQHLEDQLSLAEAMERAVISSRQYAKRQGTWFRNQYAADLIVDHVPQKEDISLILQSL